MINRAVFLTQSAGLCRKQFFFGPLPDSFVQSLRGFRMNALAYCRTRRVDHKTPTGTAVQQVQRHRGVEGRRDAYWLTDKSFHIAALRFGIAVFQSQHYR